MIVCKTCGAYNKETDAFCGSCGGFLEWTGEKMKAPEPAPLPAEEEGEPARKKSFMERVTSAMYMDVWDKR
ncbi:MAG: hypothetical protein QOH52_2891, partial [Pseudonocardiales bacterium]|nr:hypothetical protein [Pseudonocardiales bacterium]